MGDPLNVLRRRSACHAEDLVVLVQQELREIGAVLTCDPGDEGAWTTHETDATLAFLAASRVSARVRSSEISGTQPVAARRREGSPATRGMAAGRSLASSCSTCTGTLARSTSSSSTRRIGTGLPDATL